MTPNGVADANLLRGRLSLEAVASGLLALARFFRPSDGWLAVALLTVNLMVVIWSVEQADWVPTPSLVSLLLMATLAGILLARIPVWGALILPIGVALGLLTIVWQITSFESSQVHLTSSDQLWSRLLLWLEAARSGAINIDPVPFAFGVMSATWMSGFLGVWTFCRHRNFWGVFVLGGTGLLSNLTYLPPNASVDLGLYLFTGLLLVARIQSVRRRRDWQRRNVAFDGHLSLLSLSDSFFLSVTVLIVAFLLPLGPKFGLANNVYEFFRTPLKGWEDDFNRLFAGLPARRPLGYRIWGDVLAFQGTIHPTTTQVLWVESPVPLYWKARTYATYTAKGWMSEGTVLKPLGWVPPIGSPQPDRGRFEVSYAVTPMYNSKHLFGSGQVVGVDRPVQIETYDSPTYTVNLAAPLAENALPPALISASAQLQQAINVGGARTSDSSLAARVPGDLRLVEVRRNSRGAVDQVVLAEVIPEQPDVLSVRSTGRDIKARDAYQITSSVSQAREADLRRAGTDYPTWVVDRYTQLPEDLPQRVRDLAAELTANSDTPHAKAKALSGYLSSLPYTLTVEPPPFDADGVDHFLFTLGRGYSEYFASAMAVMLRSVGVPARLATGYTTGDKVVKEDIYVVNDSHSHGWVEAYMPGYGWIPFEPTPGRILPNPVPTLDVDRRGGVTASGTDPAEDSCLFEFEECEGDELFPPGSAGPAVPLPWGGKVQGLALWLTVGLLAFALLAGLAALFWRRYMVATDDPHLTFRRLAWLGALASVGPVPHETPYQYRRRLWEAVPTHREAVSVVIDCYVRSLYGRKWLDDAQRSRLAQAWVRLRWPLLVHSLRRRNP